MTSASISPPPRPCSSIVRERRDAVERLLLVGHNPGLEELALRLPGRDGDALRGEVEVKYPTGTVAEIELPVEHWAEVAEGTGRIVRFIRPRDLDPGAGAGRGVRHPGEAGAAARELDPGLRRSRSGLSRPAPRPACGGSRAAARAGRRWLAAGVGPSRRPPPRPIRRPARRWPAIAGLRGSYSRPG